MYIESQRLIIRYFKGEDGPDLYEYLSNEKVVEYEPYDAFTYGQAMDEAKIRALNKDFFAVALKTGKVIGNLYFSRGEYDTWEIGYVFNSRYWGHGYAAESAGTLITYGIEHWNVRRVAAMCNPKNQRSWKLLENLGFRREGTLLKNIYFFQDNYGQPLWQDTYQYGLLKEEWNEGKYKWGSI